MYHLGGSRFLEYQTAASRLNRYSARKVYASYLTRRLILEQCLNLFASTGSNRCWAGTGAAQSGCGATALPGVGWAATFYVQTDAFPLNFGVFNSLVSPL